MQTVTQFASRHGLSTARVRVLLAAGRIRGATKTGSVWLIPDRAKLPRKGLGGKNADGSPARMAPNS